MNGAVRQEEKLGTFAKCIEHLLAGRHCAELCDYNRDSGVVPTVTEFSECSGKARKDTGNYTVMCSYRAKDGGLHQGA